VKILLTTPTYPPFNSGLGNVVFQQAQELVKSNFEVIIATYGKERNSHVDTHLGVNIEEFSITGADHFLRPIKGDIESYIEFLTTSTFDAIIMHAWQNWATDLIFHNIKSISGRKLLYSHCISTNTFFWQQPIRSTIRYLSWRPYYWDLAAKLSQLDAIIFLSDCCDIDRFADVTIAKKTGINYSVIPNSLSRNLLDFLKGGCGHSTPRDRLISVGSYDWQKGHDFVLRAYAKSDYKNKMPLHFFGQQNTAYLGLLKKIATKYGLNSDFVHFHTGVSGNDLLHEYCKSALFISGSHTECQPLVILDAMGTGTPFIARSTGCISSMSGGVPVNSSDNAALAINNLLANRRKWKTLSRSGQKDALEMHHPNTTIKSLIKLLSTMKIT
jgi:glycosyltransferase involved in cell wall biosynthesis